jgi:hypothetical protein
MDVGELRKLLVTVRLTSCCRLTFFLYPHHSTNALVLVLVDFDLNLHSYLQARYC